jgi:AmiR/NasT family two-component response regulator
MYAKNTFKGIVVNTIDTQSLIPVLVASIQELYAEVEKLKAEIKALRH